MESREAEGMKDRVPSPERQKRAVGEWLQWGVLAVLIPARVAPGNSSTPIDNGF